MVGRQLPFFSLLVPFWLIWAFAGRKGMLEIWPAILVSGVSFAIPQFLVSNYIGPELVDMIAAIVSMVCLILFLRVWRPKTIWTSTSLEGPQGRRRRSGDRLAPGARRRRRGRRCAEALAQRVAQGSARRVAPHQRCCGVKLAKHSTASSCAPGCRG